MKKIRSAQLWSLLALSMIVCAPPSGEAAQPEKPRVILSRSQRAASFRLQIYRTIQQLNTRELRHLRAHFRVAARSEPFLSASFKKEKVPLTLVGIGFLESDFRAHAVGNGTLGVFQLQAGTARRFGLKVSRALDERKDVVRSAECVARYLRHLYEMFNDWGLVVVAYKMGEGNLQKVLDQKRVKSMNELFPSLLPSTRRYLLRVMAYGILYQEYLRDERVPNRTRS